jgi:hypothetical protein
VNPATVSIWKAIARLPVLLTGLLVAACQMASSSMPVVDIQPMTDAMTVGGEPLFDAHIKRSTSMNVRQGKTTGAFEFVIDAGLVRAIQAGNAYQITLRNITADTWSRNVRSNPYARVARELAGLDGMVFDAFVNTMTGEVERLDGSGAAVTPGQDPQRRAEQEKLAIILQNWKMGEFRGRTYEDGQELFALDIGPFLTLMGVDANPVPITAYVIGHATIEGRPALAAELVGNVPVNGSVVHVEGLYFVDRRSGIVSLAEVELRGSIGGKRVRQSQTISVTF